jgi:hypothetical protein
MIWSLEHRNSDAFLSRRSKHTGSDACLSHFSAATLISSLAVLILSHVRLLSTLHPTWCLTLFVLLVLLPLALLFSELVSLFKELEEEEEEDK